MIPNNLKLSPIITLSSFALASIMLWASSWQWTRYHEKVELVQSYSVRSKVPAIPFPSDPGIAGDTHAGVSAVIHKKVSLRGEYDLDRQMIVINRSTADGPGFWLLTPFKISGTGAAVLVSRGFIPFEDDSPEKWRKYDVIGEQELVAVAQPTVKQRFSFGPANPETGPGLPFQIRWLFPEAGKIAAQLPYPVVTSVYLQKLGPGPLNGFPQEDVRIEIPPSTHFWYTFEWIFLAFATVTLTLLYQIFRPHRQRNRQNPAALNGHPGLNGRSKEPAPEQLLKSLILLAAMTVFTFIPTAWATTDPGKVPDQAQLDEQFGKSIDLSIKLRNSEGDLVTLRDLLVPGRPTVLVPVYFHCPNLCGLLQGGVVDAVNRADLMLGTDYSIVSFSIDPEETTANAKARQEEFTAKLNSPTEAQKRNWHFVTGDRENITNLVRQIGFKYVSDDKEFIHAAILVILSPEGTVSRYFYGIQFEPSDFKMGLVEASAGKIGSAIDRILMFCFHFDSTQGKYTLAIMNLVRIICLAFVLALVGSIIYLKKHEKKGL